MADCEWMEKLPPVPDHLIPLYADEERPPGRVYKYQPITTQSLENLSKQALYLAQPTLFNDPFESLLEPGTPEISDGDWKRKYQDFRKGEASGDRWSPPEILDGQYLSEGVPNTAFRDRVTEGFRQKMREVNRHRANAGIACLAEQFDDVLMWSHYADGHRGLCLELDATESPACVAHRVRYAGSLVEHFGPVQLPDGRGVKPTKAVDSRHSVDLLTTKHSNWKYEREWRILSRKGGHTITYFGSLRRIFLGAKMSESHKHLVRSIYHEEEREYVQMHMSTGRFSLHSAPA